MVDGIAFFRVRHRFIMPYSRHPVGFCDADVYKSAHHCGHSLNALTYTCLNYGNCPEGGTWHRLCRPDRYIQCQNEL